MLVLLPGMDGTGRLFAPFEACLDTGIPVRVMPYAEQAGAGYEALADRLAPLLPTSPFVLLGESFAGPLAILLAARRPPGLCGLVLAATFARSPRPWAKRLSALVPLLFMSRLWAHASLPFLIGNRASESLKATYIDAVAGMDNASLRGRLAATLAVDVSTELASVAVPLLYLRATRDVLVPRAASAHIASIHPGAIVASVDGPHGILQSNPRECAKHVRDFVAGLPGLSAACLPLWPIYTDSSPDESCGRAHDGPTGEMSMTRELANGLRGLRLAAVPVLLLATAGCASGPKKPAPPIAGEPALAVAPTVAAGAGPTVKDLRPLADKTRDMHSLWITSCDYGISTLPELPGNPTGPSTLANDMAALPGDPWHGHTVEVVHYATYLNQKRMLKGTVSTMYGGLLPYLMLKAGEDCAEAKMHGGYYAGTEILNFFPPIIVEMTVKIDGAVHHQRTVYSTKPPIDPHLKQPWEAAEVVQAMTKANHALLASLGTAVAQPPAAASTPTPTPAATAQARDDEGFINTNPASR